MCYCFFFIAMPLAQQVHFCCHTLGMCGQVLPVFFFLKYYSHFNFNPTSGQHLAEHFNIVRVKDF